MSHQRESVPALRTDDLDYELPEELIATEPVHPRDSARLLVVSRSEPDRLEHRVFRELDDLLRPAGARASMPADLLVVNATKVMPARFLGVRVDTGGHVEGLYLGPAPMGDDGAHTGCWRVLLKMRRMREGVRVELLDHAGKACGETLVLVQRADQDAGWIVRPERAEADAADAPGLLRRVGLTPVPPYILAARKRHERRVDDAADRAEYQTVYAHGAGPGAPQGLHGSVAAPTAGLHFTPALLDRLASAGVERAEVMLDVGMGTFKPVETPLVNDHPMHSEFCCAAQVAVESIERARARGGRVVAVGTTAARTLESFDSLADLRARAPGGVHTRLLITPGWRWRHVDALITNFHLPRTTLLAMVAAMLVREGDDPLQGARRLLEIYRCAVRERYRFYSYGDAMLVLP